jgi:hypothetical protein
VVPGQVKFTFTLDMPCELAERLSPRAIREQQDIGAVIIDALRRHNPMTGSPKD